MTQQVDPPETSAERVHEPANGMRTFLNVLVNTLVANVTTSYLWFALTFWVYLETRSVLATGIVGGAYMLLVAVFGILFGTLVDRYKKHRVMLVSSIVTFAAFALAGGSTSPSPSRRSSTSAGRGSGCSRASSSSARSSRTSATSRSRRP